MATHDYVIANGTGAAVRSDLNNALAAIVSNNSSSTEPGTTYAYQWWADTNANVLKIRNSANDGWITLRELDGTMLIEDGSAASPGLAFADDTNTGVYSPAADNIALTTGGGERLRVNSTESVFNEDSNSYDFRVESNGDTHMLFVDGSADAVGIGVSSPVRPLHVDGTAFVSGTSPQLRLNGGAGDSNDDDRAMFGLATANGHFFSGSAAGDTVIRTTNGGNLLFGEGTTETARLDSNGRLGIGVTPAAQQLQVHKAGTNASYVHITNGVSNGTSSDGMLVGLDSSAEALVWNQENTVMKFAVNNAERMRLTTSGLTFNGDTAADNALDDYEKGTFTPVILSGMNVTSYTSTSGDYMKVGITVYFCLRFQASGTNVGSHLRIQGLPFTSSSGRREGSASFGYFGNLTGNNDTFVTMHIPGNADHVDFYNPDGTTFLGNSGNGIAGRTLHIRGFYFS